jgi:HK97 family phage major capsid protein
MHKSTWSNTIDRYLREGRTVSGGSPGSELATKIGGIEEGLRTFIGEHKARLLAIEQRMTAPRVGDDTPSEVKAPIDPQTKMPILGRQHKMWDNLPEKRGLDAGKYFKGLITGSWEGAPEERKSFDEATGAAGAYVLPLEIAAQFIDFARNASACVRAGATTYPMMGNSLRVPVLTQDLTATWKAELADIQDAGGMLDKHDAVPKTLAGTVLVSVELFEDAPSLFAFLQGAFGRSMGQQLDFAGLRGADTYGPVGLLTNGLVHQTPGSGEINYDQISAAIEDIRDRNFEPNSYVISPEGAGELNRTRAVPTGNYLAPPDDVRALGQYRTVSADNDVYVGQWEWLWFLPRTSINLEVSRVGDGTAWKKLGVSMRAYLRADVVAVNPNAFEIISNFGS